MAKLSQARIIGTLTETRGMIAVAARKLGCNRNTIYNYIARYPAVAEARENARELTTDTAELRLYKAIDEGEPWAVQFYLKTQGKARGYVEKQEIESTGDVRIRIIREAP